MVTVTQLASTRQKPISEIHSTQPMRNLAALVLVQLTLTPKLLCIIATTEEFGKNRWRIHKCSSAWLQLYAWWGRKLIFASLSVHMIKKIRLLFKEGKFMCYSYDNLSQYFEKAGMTQPKQESLISRRERYELHYTSSYQQSFCRQLPHTSPEYISQPQTKLMREVLFFLNHLSLSFSKLAALYRKGLLMERIVRRYTELIFFSPPKGKLWSLLTWVCTWFQ